MKDEVTKFMIEMDLIDKQNYLYLYYDTFYLINYLYKKGYIDLDKLIECKDSEYKKVVNEVLNNGKIKKLNSVITAHSDLDLLDFTKNREEIFEFIKHLDLYDDSINNYFDYNEDFISNYVNFKKCSSILSVFASIRNNDISQNCNVDVIYEHHQNGDALQSFYRNTILELNNYNYYEDTYPYFYNGKKYDLVYLDCVFGIDLLDKFGTRGYGYFESDYTEIFDNMLNLLNKNGTGVVRIPFTYVSKLPQDLLKSKIFEKIVFLPKRDAYFNYEKQFVYDVYIIVNKRINEKIEFINLNTNEKCSVKSDIVAKNNGFTNIEMYLSNNPITIELYKIKERNENEINLIKEESAIINKLIDEFNLEK